MNYTKNQTDQKIRDRVEQLICEKVYSPESTAARLSDLIIKANEAAFKTMMALNDMGIITPPECIAELYEAMDDLDIPRV